MEKEQGALPNGKTLSLIAGTTVCQAKCPFCISKATPFQGMGQTLEPINIERLEKACALAKSLDIRNVMITGKGEPVLYPEHIDAYLEVLGKHHFGSVELQTNGLAFGNNPEKYDPLLKRWREKGLDLIAISVVHYKKEKNREIYTANQDYMDLPEVIARLHAFGYKVRLSCTLLKGYIDSVEEMKKMIGFVHDNGVEQLTMRRVEAVENNDNIAVYTWTKPRVIETDMVEAMRAELDRHGRKISKFFYNGALYEYGDSKQNVCFTVCFTTGLTNKSEGGNEIRHLIYFPSGKIITDWRYDTAAEGQPAEINGVKI